MYVCMYKGLKIHLRKGHRLYVCMYMCVCVSDSLSVCMSVCMYVHMPTLPGQETTANTLSFAVALTCTHPEVHDRLVCEVDEVLGRKSSVSAEDLERLQYTEQVITRSHVITLRRVWSIISTETL